MSQRRIVIFSWADSVHIQRWSRALFQRGYNIRIVSAGGSQTFGIDTIALPHKNRLSYLLNSGKAVRAAREFKPHLVHVHYAGGFGRWGLKSGITPLLVSVWGSDISVLPNSFLTRGAVVKTLGAATHITATSNWLMQETLKLSPNSKDKIDVIPFGVDLPETIRPIDHKDKLSLCFIKAHRPTYGPDILIKAIAIADKAGVDLSLSMAGEGTMTAELQELARTLGIEKRIEFVGQIDYNNLNRFIAEHDVMVMPSRHESFGVAVLDSYAAARPVIATDVEGVSELVEHNVTGKLVPSDNPEKLAETIIGVAKERDRIETMGLAGYRLAKERFQWEASVDKMCELYERLIDEKEKQK